MEYRFLGNSGFKVPALGFGAATLGGKARCSAHGAIPVSRRRASLSGASDFSGWQLMKSQAIAANPRHGALRLPSNLSKVLQPS